jgi:cilia- and flagella-associated protein 57
MIIGFHDSIRVMNILDSRLVEYFKVFVHGCTQVKFAHGGHLFAICTSSGTQVYKFYTMEHPLTFNFVRHESTVQSLQWFEDDSGFVTLGVDRKLYFWNLYKKDINSRGEITRKDTPPEPKWFYDTSKVMFTSAFVYKDESTH